MQHARASCVGVCTSIDQTHTFKRTHVHKLDRPIFQHEHVGNMHSEGALCKGVGMHAPSTHRRCAVSKQVLLAVPPRPEQCLGRPKRSGQTGGAPPATAMSCDAGHRASLAQTAVDGQQCRRVEASSPRQPHPTEVLVTSAVVGQIAQPQLAHTPHTTSTPTPRAVELLAMDSGYSGCVACWESACAKEKAKPNGSLDQVWRRVYSRNCVSQRTFCDWDFPTYLLIFINKFESGETGVLVLWILSFEFSNSLIFLYFFLLAGPIPPSL